MEGNPFELFLHLGWWCIFGIAGGRGIAIGGSSCYGKQGFLGVGQLLLSPRHSGPVMHRSCAEVARRKGFMLYVKSSACPTCMRWLLFYLIVVIAWRLSRCGAYGISCNVILRGA
jgi:hypothetical protein